MSILADNASQVGDRDRDRLRKEALRRVVAEIRSGVRRWGDQRSDFLSCASPTRKVVQHRKNSSTSWQTVDSFSFEDVGTTVQEVRKWALALAKERIASARITPSTERNLSWWAPIISTFMSGGSADLELDESLLGTGFCIYEFF